MDGLFVNTVQFRFPSGAPQPSWIEIADFVKKLDSDVVAMETCYKISHNKCVYIKYKCQEAMEKTLRRNTETLKFRYASGKSIEVRMTIAGNNVRYVRVFDLPPEITDNELSSVLGAYGAVERTMREKFPAESGISQLYTGVRGVYIDVVKEIPPTLVVSNRRGRVFYDGLRNKCFACLLEGHRRDSCPSRMALKSKVAEAGQGNTYAGVVETGTAPSPNEIDLVHEEIIESTEEESNDESQGKISEQQDMEIVHKTDMDKECYEKYGITDYSGKLAEKAIAVTRAKRGSNVEAAKSATG